MDYSENQLSSDQRLQELFHVLFVFSLSMLGFLAIGPTVSTLIVSPFINTPISDVFVVLSDPYNSEDGRILVYTAQAGATLGMFCLPLIYLWFKRKSDINNLSQKKSTASSIILAILIVFALMPVMAHIIDWNESISLPDFMSNFESKARQFEDNAAKLTIFMTTFVGLSEFFIALIIMAILPALGEELVFRGFIQNSFFKSFNNIHIAIWLSAAIFSAIHMQFFGFFPRLLLGVIFGYLYFYSGNIWVPTIAHFTQNGFTLLMFYLHNTGQIEYDIQNSEPPLASLFIFSIITFGLIYYFRKLYSKQQNG